MNNQYNKDGKKEGLWVKIYDKYDFVNITESMVNLKEFLHLRDTRKEFEEVKSLGYVGIPAILTDDNKIILGDDVLKIK